MHVIDWLLEDDAPGVQYLARRDLLGESTSSRPMAALRKRCSEYAPVDQMLRKIDRLLARGVRPSVGWDFGGDYAKYAGTYWTFMFLAEMFADPRDDRAQRLARHVLSRQLENGGFSASGRPDFEVVCLSANMLRSLVHFGFGDHEAVRAGYGRLAERILPHGGIPCRILDYCLHNSCKMSLPQTLRAVAVAPSGAVRRNRKRLVEVLVKQMLGIRVFQFVRPDAKQYRAALRRRPKGVKEREVRAEWMKTNTFPDAELLPKPGWLRFGFPRSYNPDLLEGMLALAEIGAKHDPAMDDALDHIESKRQPDGRWKLDESLNGKMLANVEHKGRASKWVTLRALTVLRHFRRAIA